MLMIGRRDLAKACYQAWSQHRDLHDPQPGRWDWPGPRPRPRWELLSSTDQATWLTVAEAAALLLVEAMGSAPHSEASA
jgi:hypothetical protein